MAKWMRLVIASFSSVVLATTALVTQLSKSTWDDFIESHEVTVALFCVVRSPLNCSCDGYEYKTNTGFPALHSLGSNKPCKVLSPEFATAAEILKDTPIRFVEVDCVKEVNHCAFYQLQSYPTIRVHHGNNQWRSYRGKQKAKSIVPYLLMSIGPYLFTFRENNITTLTSLDEPVLVAHIAKEDEASTKIFEDTAFSLLNREKFVFGVTTSSRIPRMEEEFQLPFIVLHNPSDEAKATYFKPFDEDLIAKFAIEAVSSPLIGRFSLESLATYIDTGLSLALIFATTLEERQTLAHTLKPLAEKHRGNLNFATVDALKLGFLAGELRLQPDRYPAFMIYDIQRDGMHHFDQSKEITKESIEAFVASFFARRKVTLRSEATLTTAEPTRVHDET